MWMDGAWFTREEDFLVVGIMGTRLEKQTNFLCNFISFQVCTPVPNGTFLFRGFHPVLESQQIMSISDGQVSC